MKKRGFPTARTRRIGPSLRSPSLPHSLFRYARSVGGKLMKAVPALIFLKTSTIFAVAIKQMIVVALRTTEMVQFLHEDSTPFWEVFVLA